MSGLILLRELAKLLETDCRQLRIAIRHIEEKHQIQILRKLHERGMYHVDVKSLSEIEPAIMSHVQIRSVEAKEINQRIDCLEKRIERIE